MSGPDRYEVLRRHSAESSALVRGCLKTALLALMRERSCKDLSVSELCRKAGVSRMAFYRNYRVVNDLFREAATDLNEETVRTLGSPFRSGTGAGKQRVKLGPDSGSGVFPYENFKPPHPGAYFFL